MNRTLKNGCLLVSLVALAGGGAWFAKSRSDATSVVTPAGQTPSAFAWQRGTQYLYDFDWTIGSIAKVDMAGGAAGQGTSTMTSAGALRGQLAFKSYGKQGETWVLGVAVQNLREAKLEAMGNDLLAAPEMVQKTFDGREAFVEVGPRGEVQHLRFRAGDPPLFKQLLQSVIAESQVVLSGAAGAREWQSTESFSVGKVEMSYAVDDNDPLFVRRTPSRLLSATAMPHGSNDLSRQVFAGESDFHLDREGYVRSIATRIDLTVAPVLEHHTVFSMTFVSASAFDVADRFAVDTVAAEVIEPGTAPVDASLRQRMDEKFAAHISQDEITRMLAGYGKGLPPTPNQLTATAAFLRLHPEACDAIATQFLDPELAPRNREFMVGILASAGSPAAQSAMRRALDVPESHADVATYGRMIQRMGFLTAPTRESMDYVVALYDSPAITGDADLHRVTGLALGSIAAHASGPMKALGDSIHARLVSETQAATTSEAKVALVTAVGNAARASDVPMLRKVAKDEDHKVRESVARALRGVDSPETRVALREMITDSSAEVARAAARSYDARPLGSQDMAELATLVSSGTASAGADGSMVTIVQGHMDANPQASEQILESVLARHPSGQGSGQIRLLLRRLRGEG